MVGQGAVSRKRTAEDLTELMRPTLKEGQTHVLNRALLLKFEEESAARQHHEEDEQVQHRLRRRERRRHLQKLNTSMETERRKIWRFAAHGNPISWPTLDHLYRMFIEKHEVERAELLDRDWTFLSGDMMTGPPEEPPGGWLPSYRAVWEFLEQTRGRWPEVDAERLEALIAEIMATPRPATLLRRPFAADTTDYRLPNVGSPCGTPTLARGGPTDFPSIVGATATSPHSHAGGLHHPSPPSPRGPHGQAPRPPATGNASTAAPRSRIVHADPPDLPGSKKTSLLAAPPSSAVVLPSVPEASWVPLNPAPKPATGPAATARSKRTSGPSRRVRFSDSNTNTLPSAPETKDKAKSIR